VSILKCGEPLPSQPKRPHNITALALETCVPFAREPLVWFNVEVTASPHSQASPIKWTTKNKNIKRLIASCMCPKASIPHKMESKIKIN